MYKKCHLKFSTTQLQTHPTQVNSFSTLTCYHTLELSYSLQTLISSICTPLYPSYTLMIIVNSYLVSWCFLWIQVISCVSMRSRSRPQSLANCILCHHPHLLISSNFDFYAFFFWGKIIYSSSSTLLLSTTSFSFVAVIRLGFLNGDNFSMLFSDAPSNCSYKQAQNWTN